MHALSMRPALPDKLGNPSYIPMGTRNDANNLSAYDSDGEEDSPLFSDEEGSSDILFDVEHRLSKLHEENNTFLVSAVRFMAERGIKQFIDISCGLTRGCDTREVILRSSTPDARVVRIEAGPTLRSVAEGLLDDRCGATFSRMDSRGSDRVLGGPELAKLIDFKEPVGILMIALMHFYTPNEMSGIIRHLHEAVAVGSHIASTHLTCEGHSTECIAAIKSVYAPSPLAVFFRRRAEIRALFTPFEVVEPGLMAASRWPDKGEPDSFSFFGGIGRKT